MRAKEITLRFKQKRALVIYAPLIALLLFSNCGDRYLKPVSYGQEILFAYHDPLMDDQDELRLYDNGLFLIRYIHGEANGTYKIVGDTIRFDYFKYEGPYWRDCIIDGRVLLELTNENNKPKTTGAAMVIIRMDTAKWQKVYSR